MLNALKIIAGTSNQPLAKKIAQYTGVPLTECDVRRFSDGEVRVQINQNIRGSDLFIIQPTNPPGENLLELLIMIDAARRASAKRITAVIPYYGYARQDRKDQPRVSITAKLVANLITTAGADRVITMDLHASQ
ncbi:MAG: ribose-phosphate diphosphokinase, partial [Candidatus Zixiibacteriota bacterium]